jgi:DNA polymerase I-like protein with 3'-5' exonuclease and polymerase domains
VISQEQLLRPQSKILSGDNWAVLDYENAMKELTRTKELFNNFEIQHMVFDLETSSILPWQGDIIMFSWAHEKSPLGYAVPLMITNTIHHPKEELTYEIPEVLFDLSNSQRGEIVDLMRDILKTVPIIGHNLKFDVRWGLWNRWIDSRKLKIKADTMTMAFQLFNKKAKKDKNDKSDSLTLKALTNKLCNINDHWEWSVYDYLGRFRLNKDKTFANLPTGLLGPYSAKDGIYNLKLYNKLYEMMPDSMRAITDQVTYAIKPFSEAETKGLAVDRGMKDFLDQSYLSEQTNCLHNMMQLPIIKRYKEAKYQAVVAEELTKKRRKPKTQEELEEEAFNIGSNQQLVEIVYGKENFGMPILPQFKTPKGEPQVSKYLIDYYLDILTKIDFKDVVEKQRAYVEQIVVPWEKQRALTDLDDFEKKKEFRVFLQNLALYKRLGKLKTTYIDPVDEESYEGTYKPEFELTFVKTGRLSSGFHTLPNKCDIKRLYISRWESIGGLFLAVDQSQLELRVVAALADETKLIEAFKNGIDVHRLTASNIYKIPLESVTDEQRSVGKTTNFAVLYGKVAKNLAEDLNCSEHEAGNILNGFFSGYDKLTAWMKAQHKFVSEKGHIVTPWGRRIPVDESQSLDKWERIRGERLSVNYPVQSSASDIVLVSVNQIWNKLHNNNMKSLFVGSVHDSIELDVYPGELFGCLKTLQEECVDNIMKDNPWITCPLEISVELGRSWGGALECEIQELREDQVVLEAEGLRKDFMLLRSVAEKCYEIQIDILSTKPIKDSKFGDDIFFKDSEHWKCRVVLSRKNI